MYSYSSIPGSGSPRDSFETRRGRASWTCSRVGTCRSGGSTVLLHASRRRLEEADDPLERTILRSHFGPEVP